MKEVLIALGSAAIAGPISIAVKDWFADRKLRRQVDAERPSQNAEQKREDFKAVTAAYRRLLKTVEDDSKRDRRECERQRVADKRQAAKELHDVKIELLREIARLEGLLQEATGDV